MSDEAPTPAATEAQPTTTAPVVEQNDAPRDVSGQWLPGQSGNPAGRPKMPKTVREVRDLARQFTPGAIETLVRVHKNPKSPPAARVAAATELLNRGWGRAPSGDLEGADGLIIKVIKFGNEQIEGDDIKVIEHDPGPSDG
jgi:hypothetical protein